MKICTRLRSEEEGRYSMVDISVVDDDHQFGWVDNELHIEGKITSVGEDQQDRRDP